VAKSPLLRVPGLCLALALALMIPAGAVRAADVDPAILKAIKTIKPSDYPSANSVLLASEQSVVYQVDGQFTNTGHLVRLVLTPEGKSEAAAMPLNYTRDAEKMEVLTARVIKASGEIVPVGPSGIKDTEQSGEANIYDPMGRSLQVTFEGVSVGDAVEISYKLTRLLPTRPDAFNDYFAFQGTDPMLLASYSVDGPAALPLVSTIYRRERSPRIIEEKKKHGDRVHYRWTVRRTPQLVPETMMNGTTELPMLIVTTDPSWENFSAWWAGLTEPQMDVSPELAAKIDALTKDARNDDERIRALYNFVASDIRYRGLGVGPRTGYTPRKASESYASRWGVCRDVAILLVAMLRHKGFEAYPVLTNVGDPVLDKIAYDGFNHAIVAMPNRNKTTGKSEGWTYMDPTAKNSIDLLPALERQQHALVATKRGEPLGIIPAVAPEANRGLARSRSVVAPDGSLSSNVTIESRGLFDMVLRSIAATSSKEEQRQLAEQVIHASLPDAELVSFSVSDPLTMNKPMEVQIGLKVPSAAVKAGNFRLLRTLVTSGALGIDALLTPILGGLEKRKYTLDAKGTLEWAQEEEVTLPPGLRVEAMPNDAHVVNAVSKVESRCTSPNSGTIRCQRAFQIKSRFIAPKQYAELKDVLADVAVISRQPVILEAQ
jgi:hypothetical protein